MNKRLFILFFSFIFIATASVYVYSSSQALGLYWYIPVTITGQSLVFNVTAYNWGNQSPTQICWIVANQSLCQSINPNDIDMMGLTIFNATLINTTKIQSDLYCNATNCYGLDELVGGGSSTPYDDSWINTTIGLNNDTQNAYWLVNNITVTDAINSRGDNETWNQSYATELFYPLFANPMSFYNVTTMPSYYNESNIPNYYNQSTTNITAEYFTTSNNTNFGIHFNITNNVLIIGNLSGVYG